MQPGSISRVASLVALAACSAPNAPSSPNAPSAPSLSTAEPSAPDPDPRRIVLSIVGTNDLHGHLERLPVLAGYLANLRAARADDGGVVLLDAGDMFQGTLASNLAEGAPVIDAYNALGYAAAAIGNHEFDFGPVGEAVVARGPNDDPRGALAARARQARFPLLTANLRRTAPDRPLELPNAPPSVLLTVAGVELGVVGVTTEDTLTTTMVANVADLAVVPLADAIGREAAALRARGAEVVVVTAHAGGRCEHTDDPDDLSSCDPEQEIFRVVRALPPGAVDAVVAGHTHHAVAHMVDGVPVIESFAYGAAFGRVDLIVADGAVVDSVVFPPERLCDPDAACRYADRPVAPDPAIAALLAPAFEAARAAREAPLGVTLPAAITYAWTTESALGNLFADLMLAAVPGADVALTNGGGLRADLPAGELRYGALFEASPFDNRFATVQLTGRDLAAIVAANLATDRGIVSLAGVTADARCRRGRLVTTLRRPSGKPVRPNARFTLVTSDFLATGGDGGLFGALPPDAIHVHDGATIRDAMADQLRARGGALSAPYDPGSPRLRYPGQRPVTCRAR